MTIVHYAPSFTDAVRRQELYAGNLVVLPPCKASLDYCEFARSLVREAFAPLDPEMAQHELSVERFAEILGKLKPAFIHHPESKRYISAMLEAYGCDLDKTYYEVPKLRSSTSDGYLTTGIAYAWHPHRDTWFAAPACQINWWVPVYELKSDNGMTFFPAYWEREVKNTSDGYNYYKWNQQYRGAHVANFTKSDPRPVPKPAEEIDMSGEVRLVPQVGAPMLFSAAQLHASVPNTSGVTRFSFDFRTVHADDVAAKAGAKLVDSHCQGHMLRDYIRATDLSHLPDNLVALYDDGTEIGEGDLVYQPA